VEIREGQLTDRRRSTDEVVARWKVEFTANCAQAAADPVPVDRRSHAASDGERNARWKYGRVGAMNAPDRPGNPSATMGPETLEVATGTKCVDQADSLWRPLARRFFRIARPARVLIR